MNSYGKYEDYSNLPEKVESGFVPQRPFDKIKKMIDLGIGRVMNNAGENKDIIEKYCQNRGYNIIDIENSIAIKDGRLIKIKVGNKKVHEEEINKIKYKDGLVGGLYDKVMGNHSIQKYQRIEPTIRVNRFAITREDGNGYYAVYRLGCFEYDGIYRTREQRSTIFETKTRPK